MLGEEGAKSRNKRGSWNESLIKIKNTERTSMKRKIRELALNMLGQVDSFSRQFDIWDLLQKRDRELNFTLLCIKKLKN